MANRATLLLTLLACSSAQTTPPAADASSQAVPEAIQLPDACIDHEIQKRGLNKYGDPEHTMYPGGTPLFDEATGQHIDRMTYIKEHHPDLAAACKKAP
jgi:hypothetical protein